GGQDVPVAVPVWGLHEEHHQLPALSGGPEHRVGVLAQLPGQSPLCTQNLPHLGRVDAVHGDVVQAVTREAVAVPHARQRTTHVVRTFWPVLLSLRRGLAYSPLSWSIRH